MPAGAARRAAHRRRRVQLPRYLEAVRPGSTNRVLEIDGELVEIAKRELGLVESKHLGSTSVTPGSRWTQLPTDSYDLVVGDAFAGESVPWHLTTAEVVKEIDRTLRPGGIVMMNVIDGGPQPVRPGRAGDAGRRCSARRRDPPAGRCAEGPPGQPGADRVAGSIAEASTIAPVDGVLLRGDDVTKYIDGARKLTDDFAPVDQLVMSI